VWGFNFIIYYLYLLLGKIVSKKPTFWPSANKGLTFHLFNKETTFVSFLQIKSYQVN
jgi:hypothetical protein